MIEILFMKRSKKDLPFHILISAAAIEHKKHLKLRKYIFTWKWM